MLGFNGGNYQLVGLFYCDKYSRETTIQGRKLLISRTFLVRQVFKGDNYSREETIRGNTVSEENRGQCTWTDLLVFEQDSAC